MGGTCRGVYPPSLCKYLATFLVSPLRLESVSIQDASSLVPLLDLEEPHLAANTHKGGAFFAGAYAKGGLVGLRKACQLQSRCTKVFAHLLARLFPGFYFTSLAVFVNVPTAMHRDVHNAPYPNIIVALSDFKNGQIWQEDPAGQVLRQVQGSDRKSYSVSGIFGATHASHPGGLAELMTMGIDFQSTEGLVVVSDTESEPEAGKDTSVAPFDPVTSRAFGQPLTCRHSKEYHEFVDGLGLCSPGRWRPEQRGRLCSWRESNHAEGLQRIIRNFVISELDDVKLMTCKLAAGRLESSPFKPEAMQRLREELASMTPDPKLSLVVPERQPFYLHLLSQSLRELGDPDWAILTQGEECFARGVPLGDEKPLERVPQVFRERTKDRRLDESAYNPDMENYSSDELSGDQLEAHFRKEEALGRM
ncbi:unnamed protein product, partial [Symbiodinium sp. CCMP2456]